MLHLCIAYFWLGRSVVHRFIVVQEYCSWKITSMSNMVRIQDSRDSVCIRKEEGMLDVGISIACLSDSVSLHATQEKRDAGSNEACDVSLSFVRLFSSITLFSARKFPSYGWLVLMVLTDGRGELVSRCNPNRVTIRQ